MRGKERKSCWVFLVFSLFQSAFFLRTDLKCDFHIIGSISRHHRPSEGNNFLLRNFVTVLEGK